MAENYWNVPKDPWKSYPGTPYTELPEWAPSESEWGKREWLREVADRDEDAGYDWKGEDAIVRNKVRRMEADKLFEESGAKWVGNKVDDMRVNTQEKMDMLDQAWSIYDNLGGIEGTKEFPKAKREGEVIDPEHWIPKGIETLRGWEEDAGDWLKYQTKYNIPNMWKNADMSGILSEIPKLIPNAITGTPEWMMDWASLPLRLGKEGWDYATGGDEVDFGGEIFKGFETSNIIPYDEEQVNKHVMEGIELFGETYLGSKAFKQLYNKAPEAVRTVLRNLYPSARHLTTSFGTDLQNYIKKHGIKMDGLKKFNRPESLKELKTSSRAILKDLMNPEGSTYKGKIKSIKPKTSWLQKAGNLAKAPWKYWRGPAQLALGTGTAALAGGLATLLYSGKAGAGSDIGEDREWEPWMEHSTSRFDRYNPNEMRNVGPNDWEARNRRVEPREREPSGPGPWNDFRG